MKPKEPIEVKTIPLRHFQEVAIRESLARQIESTCIILRNNPNGYCTCAAHKYARMVRG